MTEAEPDPHRRHPRKYLKALSARHSDTRRVIWLDLARSVALAGMVVFHFTRDLELFDLIAAGTTASGAWSVFARLIAGSFIFLSGISFVLAQGAGFRAGPWAKRVAVIVAAAVLVSVVTYLMFPSQFVYFGILHLIATASLLGLLFLRLPVWALALSAIAIILVGEVWGRALFSSVFLAWTGLSTTVRPSMDFLPLVPWLAAFLAGMAVARAFTFRRHHTAQSPVWVQRLAWPGRHSLAVYLVHQPVLIGLVWCLARVA